MDYSEKYELCERLWREYKDAITNLCSFKLSSHPDEVDNVVAEVFFYLCKVIFDGAVLHNPRAWLNAVANNLIKKKYIEINKIKLRQVSFIEEDICKYGYDEEDLFSLLVSDNTIKNSSENIIGKLKIQEQELYKYVYKDRLKMKEIALVMNLTEGAVKERNYRLKKKLKYMIKEEISNKEY